MKKLVRWATRWDRSAIVELLQEAARQNDITTSNQALEATLDYCLAHPGEMRCAVAQLDERHVGLGFLLGVHSAWHGRHYGIIEALYVLTEAWESGIHDDLCALLLQEAKRRELFRVDMHIREDDEVCARFHEAQGFRYTGNLIYSLHQAEENDAGK